MSHVVNALAVDGAGNLYAVGAFASAGGVPADSIARWDGSAWSVLGSGLGGSVNALVVDGIGSLYAGSYYVTIARWDGSAWSTLGSGLDGGVNALVVDGAGNAYAGGWFTDAGGVTALYIAKWDGSAWSALGSGMNGRVLALALDGSGDLYAGGAFTSAGGVPANSIAKWDGSAWSALGSGMDGEVRALAVDGAGNLYAGGDFTSAGGVAATKIARWDGSAWYALGTGMNARVNALAVDGGNLYVGGSFWTAGGVTANHIAKWNGTAWSPLGSGLGGFTGGEVYALATDGAGNLYAGGEFTDADSLAARNIAKWNGSTWFSLGSGIGGDGNWVNALAVDGIGNLYAGGEFGTAGALAANYIAKWDGGAWSTLGSGMSSQQNPYSPFVSALALNGTGNLYVGGQFDTAGGKPSAYIGYWVPGPTLSITLSSAGTGRVTSDPPGVDCGAPCNVSFDKGTVVTLTAIAAVSSNFDGWSGACSGTEACVVTMDTSKEVTATFTLKTYVGTLTKAGNGSGNLNISPPGVNCGAGCNEITGTFTHGTSVTLTPLADPGSIFAGWSGACSGTGVCVVTMNGPKQATATFVLARDLTVSRAGNGSGTVTSNSGGIACGGTCTAPFADGTVVTLTVTADTFSAFTGWSGACTGTEACVVTMDSAKGVTATFTLQTFPLSVGKTGNGSGTVASSPAGIACGGTCSAAINAGAVVTLTALPDASVSFAGWTGACTGTGACVVVMDGARAVTATFTLQTFPVTVNKTGNGSGTVASSPAGITCGGTCGANFTAGSMVTLTATADAGSSFAGWSGACTGTGACVVAIDAAKMVTATFGVPGAVTPQGSTMYYGQQLAVEGEAVGAAPVAVTKLVVFTATAPAGIFLLGAEGSAPYAGEVSAGRLINRLLATGCGGGACSAVNCTVYAPDGSHTGYVVISPVPTDYLYLPQVSRQ